MPFHKPLAALVAVAYAALAPVAHADDDAAALRKELDSLKSDYESRVAALESRIAQLESVPAPAPADIAPPEAAPAAAGPNAFNPAVSVVLAGNYADTSREPGDWRAAGFM